MQKANRRRFILEQGFDTPASEAECGARYSALTVQPRAVALTVLAGIALQSAVLFWALGVVLAWSALVPRLNPFELVYNATPGRGPEAVRLTPAPAPRRFAQAMAAVWTLAIGGALFLDWTAAAVILQTLFVGALAALLLRGFCLGSFVYHRMRTWWASLDLSEA